MIDDYLIYVTLAITVTAIPGPAVLLTIKNSIRYGYKIAIANIFGNFFAMILLASLSALGLGAVILASTTLFSIMKIMGCAYLIYLGIKVWKTPVQQGGEQSQPSKQSGRDTVHSVFKEGFGVGIANPKAIVFFTALFPQFIDPTAIYLPQFLTLILTIEGISFMVLTTYALCAAKAAPLLIGPAPRSYFNKITGGAFIGFGLCLIGQE